jgi:hypothetical protein
MIMGGNLIVSGIPDVLSMMAASDWSALAQNVLHISPPAPFLLVLQNNERDFVGAKGRLGYPTVLLDSTKVPSAADSGSALRHIAVNLPFGFAETIGTFDSRSNDAFFENLPLGVRFQGPDPVAPARRTYSVVYFGFPLYYGQKSSVIQAMRKAVSDVYQ